MEPAQGSEREFDLARIVVFSDAVFAIVITLLVLPLATAADFNGLDTLGHVLDLWPRAVVFAVSFLVVGQFWIVHHRMYSRFTGCDLGLVWLDLISMLTVTFMPFPAAVLGEQSTTADRFPVVLYAMSLTVASVAFTATWLYALRRGLVDERRSAADRHAYTVRSLASNGVFVGSIGIAFLGLLPAVLCWLVVLPVVRNLVVRRWQPVAA
jgi:uncharacterized membrane protein